MKKITCVDCEEKFEGGSKEAVMKAMHPHYREAHKDVMAGANEEKKKAWFAELDKRWNEAADM